MAASHSGFGKAEPYASTRGEGNTVRGRRQLSALLTHSASCATRVCSEYDMCGLHHGNRVFASAAALATRWRSQSRLRQRQVRLLRAAGV
ncbi:hypothetical protein LSCM4_03226 [Leishmania orientalis]|uniref:Uncharacterized protein n=1 Tax=Leishmania orientalis TaxID=2249476 RepID=A0A836GDV0_9TRYP|nr:hypothetical protein LSCM4_03226 [Leishmania orientalis]